MRWLVAIVMLALVCVLGWRPVTDLDFPLHVAGGRWIAQHGAVPELDPFTYTLSDQPYLAYHWLFQLGAYGIERAWGGTGITLARWLCVMATALLVADVLRIRRSSPLAVATV